MSLDGISVDVLAVVGKILGIANTMIGKAALPNLTRPKRDPEGMGIATLDQLQRTLQREARRRRDQQMHMLRHQNKGMQQEASVAFVTVNDFQEETNIRFHDEQLSALPT